jgi:hypothetical protein
MAMVVFLATPKVELVSASAQAEIVQLQTGSRGSREHWLLASVSKKNMRKRTARRELNDYVQLHSKLVENFGERFVKEFDRNNWEVDSDSDGAPIRERGRSIASMDYFIQAEFEITELALRAAMQQAQIAHQGKQNPSHIAIEILTDDNLRHLYALYERKGKDATRAKAAFLEETGIAEKNLPPLRPRPAFLLLHPEK